MRAFGQFSPDGRWVVYVAPEGVVWLRDRDALGTSAGSYVLLSHTTASSVTSANGVSRYAAVAVKGPTIRVVFSSTSDQLVTGEVNRGGVGPDSSDEDVFLWSGTFVGATVTQTGSIARLSVTNAGTQVTDGVSSGPAISGDGSKVVFSSRSATLVTPDTNGQSDVFVYDVVAGSNPLRMVSAKTGPVGTQPTFGAQVSRHPVSSGGRWIVYAAINSSAQGNLWLYDYLNPAVNTVQVAPLNAGVPVGNLVDGGAPGPLRRRASFLVMGQPSRIRRGC